jgi:hypothetical protein
MAGTIKGCNFRQETLLTSSRMFRIIATQRRAGQEERDSDCSDVRVLEETFTPQKEALKPASWARQIHSFESVMGQAISLPGVFSITCLKIA